MSKFVYEENEIRLTPAPCGLCMHSREQKDGSCSEYEQIPEDVKNGTAQFPHLIISSYPL